MTEIVPDKKDAQENMIMGVLAYINILCFIPLLLKKDSAFAQFHAKQGLALFIVETASWILSFTVILIPVTWIIVFACIVASVYGIVNALGGRMVPIPGADWIVKKINL